MGIATAETRRRAIEAYQNGVGSQAEIAHFYHVDRRTFQRWLARYRATGEYAPQPRGHRRSVITDEQLKALDQAVQKCPDATLEELQRRNPVEGSIRVVKRALDRLGYRYKKKRFGPTNKTGRRSGSSAPNGLKRCPLGIRPGWCSWMKPGPKPI